MLSNEVLGIILTNNPINKNNLCDLYEQFFQNESPLIMSALYKAWHNRII